MPYHDHHDEVPQQQMDLLMQAATRQVLEGVEFSQFIDNMMRFVAHTGCDMFMDADPEHRQKCFFWIFVSLWNVAPLPRNGFKPDVVPLPKASEACLCGSGLSYANCCMGIDLAEQPPSDFFWPFIARQVPYKTLLQWGSEQLIPLEAAAIVADVVAQDGKPGNGIKMLSAYLAGAADSLSFRHSGVLDLYCDLCDEHYASDRKKIDFLMRMVAHDDNVIRAEAWQRLASYYQDRGDIESSRDALAQAMRADPANPSHCLLELVLLISSHDIDQAKQRATFWLHSFRKREEEFPELIQTLKEAQTNPTAALGAMMLGSMDAGSEGDPLNRITRAFKAHMGRELPSYQVKYTHADTSDPIMANAAILQPPKNIERLEEDWQEINPLVHQFDEESIVWQADSAWIIFLEQHPESFDSIEILADLLDLICNSPYASSPIDTLEISQLIAERGVGLSKQAGLKSATTLPWVLVENRPLLQVINHLINIFTVKDEDQEAILCAEEYIALNPHDNHGFRNFLMNYYVEQGLDDKGLALAKQYADDVSPDTLYGSVLMYYRAGNLVMAQKMLECAMKKMPKVASYLIKKKVKKPVMSDYGIQVGGDDQAWLYRDTMRHVWAATPGCIEWLKKQMERKS
ncbi:hypothetical protein TDB9533_01596 [Thalassocella blandensis]|nr:hypothetical protein TDB9533_01596 [Thalassocella blandensis]